ncbi:ribonuclease J, partial [Leptolyngbyaceae cyanobacterium CCMR0082]|nr:ribonuclease J [Adonisia turfae CCMR0081]NEZ62839.1 ribonuclease J [Adonisia turfae CCMR0082]
TVDSNGKLLTPPAVHLRGVVTKHSQADWDAKVYQVVTAGLRGRWNEVIDTSGNQRVIRWDGLRSRLEEEVRHFVRRELPKRYPLIVFLMQPIDTTTPLEPAQPIKKRVVAV